MSRQTAGGPRGRSGTAGPSFVLPRLLRRPARIAGRLVSGEIEMPRHLLKVATIALFAATGLHGMVQGGHSHQVVQTITAHSGFAIDDVRITGNSVISELDLFQEVGLDGWTSLIGYDADAARERIEKMAWVESATVRKVYPTSLEIDIVERGAAAIWQHGSQLSIVDAKGRVIAPLSGPRHAGLPLVVGMGAAESGAALMDAVSAYPGLAGQVRGYIRVADRRWDLRLGNGITVRLPENGEQAAIERLLAFDREHGLLSRDIDVIDMRFDDRLVVRLTPSGFEVRDAALKQRLGKVYKPERRT
jgi:cell division protein FtsQ